MTKRNASEYIIGSIYRDTHARYCRRRAKLRWTCRCSVAHSTRVGRFSWLSRRSVSCIRVALHAVSMYTQAFRVQLVCNIPIR